MGLDLVSSWVLAFFGACVAGMAVGALVARFTTFELGLGVGMALPGIVSLTFAVTFLDEYRDFTTSPHRAPGKVVAVEDQAVNDTGSVTTPVAVVEWATAAGERHQAHSGGGSGLAVGDAVTVVYDPRDPEAARVGRPEDLQGGAVAAMLFGTFPASAAVFFLFSWACDRWRLDRWERPPPSRGVAAFLGTVATLVMATGILWPLLVEQPPAGVPTSDDLVVQDFMTIFAITSIGLWMHAAIWVVTRRELRWALAIAVIAVNFDAWVVALHVLGAG